MFKLTRAILGTIGQILLVILILPLLCLAAGAITGAQNEDLIVLEMLGQIDYFEAIMNAISTFMQMHVSDLAGDPTAYMTHIASIFDSLDVSMFQLLDVTLCVALCNMVWDILKNAKLVRGAHIISSVLGVFLGYLVLALFDIPMMASVFLMLLYVVLDMIFVQDVHFHIGDLLIKYLKAGLKFGFEMLSTLWLTGFVAVLLIIWQGNITNVGMAIFLICMFIIPWSLLKLAESYIFDKK